jgi:hypothetical protein
MRVSFPHPSIFRWQHGDWSFGRAFSGLCSLGYTVGTTPRVQVVDGEQRVNRPAVIAREFTGQKRLSSQQLAAAAFRLYRLSERGVQKMRTVEEKEEGEQTGQCAR